MLPSQMQPGSNAWGTGIDEWGRVWQGGSFVGGAVDTDEDLARYSPALTLVDQRFDPVRAREKREASEATGETVCTMCGRLCAIATYNEAVAQQPRGETGR